MPCLAYRAITLRTSLSACNRVTPPSASSTIRRVASIIHQDNGVTSATYDDTYLPFDRPGTVEKQLVRSQAPLRKSSHVKQAGDVDGLAGSKSSVASRVPGSGLPGYTGRTDSRNFTSDPKHKFSSLPQTRTAGITDFPDTFAFTATESNRSLPETPASAKDCINGIILPRPGDVAKGGVAQKRESTQSSLRASSSRGQSGAKRRQPSNTKRETWQVQKDALAIKFGATGWSPRKRLSPDALEGIRALHAQFPEKYPTPVLANQFEMSAEAIRRILKSKWRPSEGEATRRRQRWDKRGERIWSQMVALGVKPPKKWREIRNHNSPRERWKDNNGPHLLQQGLDQFPRQSSSNNQTKGHRNILSLKSPQSVTAAASASSNEKNVQAEQKSIDRGHRRSVSIVSISGDAASSEKTPPSIPAPRRPGQSHGRAASLHILPQRYAVSSNSPNSSNQIVGSPVPMRRNDQLFSHDRAATVPALLRSSTFSAVGESEFAQGTWTGERRTATKPYSPRVHNRTPSISITKSPNVPQSIPFATKLPKQASDISVDDSGSSTFSAHIARQDQSNQLMDFRDHLTKIVSSTSNDVTPRSSTDFYSVSNDSSDTLASEYVQRDYGRFPHQSVHTRQQSLLAPSKSRQHTEKLIMGYSTIVGQFHLDASLVNTSTFDEVKKKGVIGNQGGGGVVRAESAIHHSGLLGSFGWSTLGESLKGFLVSNEMSSLKETTKTKNSKWIPLVSTPQSLLFVDLSLGPREKQSYSYSFRLPAGIPPSYRGKAVKVSYNIVIGVQRATRSTERHTVRQLEFPFRVFPSVNARGETMGHDLMSPHVLLHGEPSISALNKGSVVDTRPDKDQSQAALNAPEEGFNSYVGQLLDTPRQDSNLGLLSPAATEARSLVVVQEEFATVEEAITSAIHQSISVKPSKLSTTRFEISRSGSRVAVIMLARPAYRLGEVIPMTVDLHKSDIQCFSLHVTLETAEHVDPSIALRSQASISRVSRKIHATQHESTISATRVCFSLAIPSNSTPEFITSGVSLEWSLRFEFVTSNRTESEEDPDGAPHGLLEEVAEDERGSVLAAVQAMSCESFDVTLPLRVYGDISSSDGNFQVQEGSL
ncbi:MAG: hypothetical protein Q9181_001044 [Wetmoreana brouardii]